MNRVLVANRGEIAVRIIRALRDTGRRSIAVYADQDLDAQHVRMADEAYALGGMSAAETYLDIDAIISVALRAGADGVHPGYGFRSESADFARAVQDAGLVWIGPPPEAIECLGDKVSARAVAERVGAPLVAGTPGPVATADEAVAFARQHGLPIAIKAAFGGGGRGMRVAWRDDDVAEQFEAARREAMHAFGRDECFVERFLDRPRHVEVQVIADEHGTVIPLGTRDCTLQRRNQKLVEEAPAPFLSDEQRSTLLDSAAAICRAAGYVGAGTVEYLLASDGTLSFLEVNTRLQVEHPVTEETTGVDLVALQFEVAEGAHLDPSLAGRRPHGHAIEFRINAEDPGRGFLPTPGTIEHLRTPAGPGIRVDSGVTEGSSVPDAFDSLMAKLIVWGEDRVQALARSRRALAEFEIAGVSSVLPVHRAIVDTDAFASDFAVHTRWIETDFAETFDPAPVPDEPEVGFTRTWIELDGRRVRLGLPAGFGATPGSVPADHPAETGAVTADMPGLLARWLVAEGDEVAAGQQIAVIEAMKMEHPIRAHSAGTISLHVGAGQTVSAGEVVASLEG